jgi:hypothetical protein
LKATNGDNRRLLLMKLAENDDPVSWLIVRVVAICFMQAKRLQSSRERKEEKSGGNENADVEMGEPEKSEESFAGHGA